MIASPKPVYEAITALYGRVAAAILLAALSPIWLTISLLIKTTSPGPVLFRALVAGRDGRVFRYYKFRTMRDGCDAGDHLRWIQAFVREDRPYTWDTGGSPVYKLTDDPRVTPVGAFLRRYSLDELPQLLNVARGEMNLVGPRPPLIDEYRLYGPHERQRLAVKPGLTGLYQVQKRGRASFSEMLQLDLDYIRNRSLWLDLRITARTVAVVVRGREVL